MEKSLSQLKLGDENYDFGENQTLFRCNGCKGTFQKPILATDSSLGQVQKYYACPRCLAKVTEVKSRKSEESKETSTPKKDMKKAVAKHEDNVECEHFLGYLGKRPKDMAIPDECLTCDRMIQCLIR
jgi:DNA-directed RNA polymerase subunit RPC12/RpoP